MINLPVICHETENFAVVFKPPRMHCAPLNKRALKQDGSETLLDWYAKIYPPVLELSGRKEGEGGLLHRLDFETQGLVLFAKNQQSLDNLLDQQKQGTLIKEYSAICKPSATLRAAVLPCEPLLIKSYFRPYGPGRKQVRPVTEEKLKGKEIAKDGDSYYMTEVIGIEKKQTDSAEEVFHFTVRIRRGFRHQIRCHLAWVGFPVLNDRLYGNAYGNAYGKAYGDGFLALRATGLFFDDPQSGKPVQIIVNSY